MPYDMLGAMKMISSIIVLLMLNSGRDFWSEVKKIRRSGSCVSGAVDGVSNASDIASLHENMRICTQVWLMIL